MTREDAEECLAKRIKVVTNYGVGEIISVAKKTDSVQWAEVKLDDSDRAFEAPRCLYISGLCRYMPTGKVAGDELVSSVF
jgi:hypothetical protein